MEKLNPAFIPFLFNSPIYIVKEYEDAIPSANTSSEVRKIPLQTQKTDLNDAEPISIPAGEKKLVIILTDEVISENQSFMEKILTAVNIRPEDTYFQTTGLFTDLKGKIEADKILSFGTKRVPQQDPLYEILNISGKVVLFADSLSVIQKDVNKKKKLWECLQKIFLNK